MARGKLTATMRGDLKTILRERGLQEKRALHTFRDATETVFAEGISLRIAEHFDLEAGLLIQTKALGVFGLVHFIGHDEGVDLAVRRHVDQATYLRHLFLTDRDLGKRQAMTVELVLVAPQGRGILHKIGRSLDKIADGTDFLHAIGVNVLPHRGGEASFAPTDVRRAFCWLLLDVQAWYDSSHAKPDQEEDRPSESEARLVEKIELEHYRLPGRRALTLDPTPGLRFHLLHGRNGCGKSTFAEALELAVTLRIERLDGWSPGEYHEVVRYQGSRESGSGDDPARVILHFRDSLPSLEIDTENLGDPPDEAPEAVSFRLDQKVMDHLTRPGEEGHAKRSEIFLRGFFPEERKKFEEYDRAQAKARKAFEALPPGVRSRFDQDSADERARALVEDLAWMDGDTPPTAEQLADGLPISREAVNALEPATGWTVEKLREAPDRLEARLGQLDDALSEMLPKSRPRLEALRLVGPTLERLGDWVPDRGGVKADEFPKHLDRWLEMSALVDLAERHEIIVESLDRAERRDWKLSWDGAVGLFAARPSEREKIILRNQKKTWIEERDESFQAVMSLVEKATETPTATAGETRAERLLTTAEIEALDLLGPLLHPGEDNAGAFGKAIDKAARSSEHQPFGDLVIGRKGWRDELGDRLAALLAAFEELDKLERREGSAALRHAAGRLGLLREALESHQTLEARSEEIEATFLRKITPTDGSETSEASYLNEALNELIALFTPARWAYDDIALSHHADGESSQRVAVSTANGDGVSPILRFNTAELNIFAVALFLLCAVRVKNEHRLLVLDDPLQNMDEMTVTTLARGLARLVRLLPENWQLLLLFHGEDDLERFRREMPAAVYSLGWLGLGKVSKKPESITADKTRSRLTAEIRDIAPLLSEGP